MDDPVLMARIEALRKRLADVMTNLEMAKWTTHEGHGEPLAALLGESSLWTGLEATLIRDIRAHSEMLKGIAEDLTAAGEADAAALSAAWTRYSKELRDCQGLLRECLEIIGSLAIRSRNLDDKTLYVADEIIRDCMTLSTGNQHYYFLVNSLGDAFCKSRARIIRLRFPEWTLWDLPLAAHELGQVAISFILERERNEEAEALRMLTPFLATQRDSLVARDAELNKAHMDGGELEKKASQWADSRVRLLVADAFATYTMGPAYACSAIMLRLDPSVAAHGEIASDSQRAQVILSVLRWMDEREKGQGYGEVISELDTAWQNSLRHSHPGHVLDAAEEAHLKQLANAFCRDAGLLTLRTAMYSKVAPNEGWLRSQEWSAAWSQDLARGNSLATPKNQGGKLRDVLNAAWLSRLNNKKSLDPGRDRDDLARVGKSLCSSIIEARSGGSPMGPNLTPGGSRPVRQIADGQNSAPVGG